MKGITFLATLSTNYNAKKAYVHPRQWKLITVALILALAPPRLLFLPPLPLLQNHLPVFLQGCAKRSGPNTTSHTQVKYSANSQDLIKTKIFCPPLMYIVHNAANDGMEVFLGIDLHAFRLQNTKVKTHLW